MIDLQDTINIITSKNSSHDGKAVHCAYELSGPPREDGYGACSRKPKIRVDSAQDGPSAGMPLKSKLLYANALNLTRVVPV